MNIDEQLKSTEKLDIILEKLYYRINDGFLPVGELGTQLGETEIILYCKKLEEDKLIITKIEPSDHWLRTQAKLTFEGIAFCEKDAYTKDHSPIIK